MDSIFNSYLDLYTLKILIPSMILILFVLFLAGYGVAKLKMLMSIDHESVGYQQEAEYISKRGRHLARYFIRAYVITVLAIGAALILMAQKPPVALNPELVAKNIMPDGSVCVAGDECAEAPTAVADTEMVAAATSDGALPGKAKYAGCMACHGADGSGGVGPALKGREASYIIDRLNAYKAKETVGPSSSLMWGQAAGLSDTDISELADYISTL